MDKLLLVFAFMIGLFGVTSRNGLINDVFPVVFGFILIAIYLLLIMRSGKIPKYNLVIAISINMLLWIFTILTPFSNYAFGDAIFYFLFSITGF